MTKWPEPDGSALVLVEDRQTYKISQHKPAWSEPLVRSIVRAEMEECAKLAESQFSNVAEKLYGQELAALIREKIKESTDADR